MKPTISSTKRANPLAEDLMKQAVGRFPRHWTELLPKTDICCISPQEMGGARLQPRTAQNGRWRIGVEMHQTLGFRRFLFYAAKDATASDIPMIALDVGAQLWERLLSRGYTAEAILKVTNRYPIVIRCGSSIVAFDRIKRLVFGLPCDVDPEFRAFYADLDKEFLGMAVGCR